MAETRDSDALIECAQQGDVHAFELLVDEHIPRLRRFARSFSQSDADADDLAQEALIKVYRSLRSYRFESAFSTWLFRVTKNCFMDARRAAASRERAAASVASHPGPADTAEAPDSLLEKAEARARIWTAIRQIPMEFRAVLVLSDIEGMAMAEVAAIEKLPLGTVKSRLHRARAQLAHLLEAEEKPGNQTTGRPVIPTEGVDVP